MARHVPVTWTTTTPTSAPLLRPYTKIHSPPRSKGTVVGRLGNRLSSAVRAGVDGYEIFQSNPARTPYSTPSIDPHTALMLTGRSTSGGTTEDGLGGEVNKGHVCTTKKGQRKKESRRETGYGQQEPGATNARLYQRGARTVAYMAPNQQTSDRYHGRTQRNNEGKEFSVKNDVGQN